MNYTKEQYDILTKYRNNLYTACYAKFIRMEGRAGLTELDEIYKNVFHTTSGIIGGCANCLLNACKKLGTLYFQDEKEYQSIEAKQAEKQAATEAPAKQTPKTAKKKPTNKNKKK